MSALKTFRVTFIDTRHMQIRVKARSAAEAVKRAEHAYLDNPRDTRVSMRFSDPFASPEAKPIVTFDDIAIRHGAGDGI
jgi:hypothetical protein